MKFLTKLRIKLAKENPDDALFKLASVETDKGVLHYDPEVGISVGADVWVENSEGSTIMPEDGDYIVNDQIVHVVSGVIESIEDKDGSVQTEMEDDDNSDVPAVPAEETGDIVSVEKFNDLLETVEAIKEKEEEQAAVIDDLTKAVLEMSGSLKSALSALDETKTSLQTALSSSRASFVKPPTPEIQGEDTAQKKSKSSLDNIFK